jgi:hypothetical protein
MLAVETSKKENPGASAICHPDFFVFLICTHITTVALNGIS